MKEMPQGFGKRESPEIKRLEEEIEEDRKQKAEIEHYASTNQGAERDTGDLEEINARISQKMAQIKRLRQPKMR